MAIQQPIATDKQNSPSHSLSHRVFANDSAADVKTIVALAGGKVGFSVDDPTAVLHLKAGTTAASTAPIKFTTQANPLTVIEPGTMEYVGRSLQFSQYLRRRGVAMSENVIITTTTVQNTVTESAALITAQHGADYLEVGKCEEIVLRGTLAQRSNPSATLTFDIKYAGVTVHSIATSASTLIATAPFELSISTTCRVVGASGTMQINSMLMISGRPIKGGSSSVSIDTTGQQDTTVTAQWGEANAANILVVEQGRVLCVEPNK